MDLTIYCFNDSYPLYTLLNGLMSYFGSGDFSGMIFLASSILLAWAFMSMGGLNPVRYTKAILVPLLLYSAFFVQTVDLHLEDQWNHDAYTVSNVPAALGVPLHLVSTIEAIFVDLVESHMMPPDATSMQEFDFFMEAAALGEVLSGQAFKEYELTMSVAQYYDDCVLQAISSGYMNETGFYRSEDLLTDANVPFPAFFTTVTGSDGSSTVMTCAQAYTTIAARIAGVSTNTAADSPPGYLAHLWQNETKPIGEVRVAMDHLADYMFTGHQDTAQKLFSQAFMMNGLKTSLGNNNPAALAALSQAEVSQATGIASMASVYIKKLPKLRAMTKMIVICFVPLVGACFLANTAMPFFYWCAFLLSVSLYLPMMAILKAVYVASAVEELKLMIDSTGGAVLTNKLSMMQWISDTSTTAGTLGMAIPSFAGMVMTLLLGRGLGQVAMMMSGGFRTAETMAARAGMGALDSSGRTAREIDLDKINNTMMEAGDQFGARLNQMNAVYGQYDSNFVGNNTGTRKGTLEDNQASELSTKGASVGGSTMASSLNSISNTHAINDATQKVASMNAAHALSNSVGTDKFNENFNRFQQGLTQEQSQQFNDQRSRVLQHVQEATAGTQVSEQEQQQLATSLTAQAFAGVSFDSQKSILGQIAQVATGASGNIGVRGVVEGKSGSTETSSLSQTASKLQKELENDSELKSFTESQAEKLSAAASKGGGTSWRQNASEGENFSRTASELEQASQSYSRSKSALDQAQATQSAMAGQTVNMGVLAGHLAMKDISTLGDNAEMSSLRETIQNGGINEGNMGQLRNAALEDFNRLVNNAQDGDINAARQAQNTFSELSSSNSQFVGGLAHTAERAMSIHGELRSMAEADNVSSEVNSNVDGSPAFRANIAANLVDGEKAATGDTSALDNSKPLAVNPGNSVIAGSALSANAINEGMSGQEARERLFNEGEEDAAGLTGASHSRGALRGALQTDPAHAAEEAEYLQDTSLKDLAEDFLK